MALDKNAYLRDGASALSANETGTGVQTGVDLVPQTWELVIPSVSGTTPTLTMEIQESDDDSNYRTIGTFGSGGASTLNTAGVYYITIKSNAKYRRHKATLGGTTPNFGNVIVAAVPAGRHTNW